MQDILREAGVDESFFLSGDFAALSRLATIPDQSALRQRADALGIDLSDEALANLQELAFERLRDQEDTGISQQRAIADAQLRQDRELVAINTALLTEQEDLTIAVGEVSTQLETTAQVVPERLDTMVALTQQTVSAEHTIAANTTAILQDIASFLSGLRAANQGRDVPMQPVEITLQNNNTLQVDGRVVAEVVDGELVTMDQQGLTVGSYTQNS